MSKRIIASALAGAVLVSTMAPMMSISIKILPTVV